MAKILKYMVIFCVMIFLVGCTSEPEDLKKDSKLIEEIDHNESVNKNMPIDKQNNNNPDIDEKENSKGLMDDEFKNRLSLYIEDYKINQENKSITSSFRSMLWDIKNQELISNNAIVKVLTLECLQHTKEQKDIKETYEMFVKFVLDNTVAYLKQTQREELPNEQLKYYGLTLEHSLALDFMLEGFEIIEQFASSQDSPYGEWGQVFDMLSDDISLMVLNDKPLIQCDEYLLCIDDDKNVFIYSTDVNNLDTTYENHIINYKKNYFDTSETLEIINLNSNTLLPTYRDVTGRYMVGDIVYFSDGYLGLMSYDFHTNQLNKMLTETESEDIHLIDLIDSTMHLLIDEKTFLYDLDSEQLTQIESDITVDSTYCKGMTSSLAGDDVLGLYNHFDFSGLFMDYRDEKGYFEESKLVVETGFIKDIKNYNKRFIYSITSDHYLYVYDPQTDENKYLFMEPVDQFYIHDNWVYFVSLQNARSIRRFNLDTEEVENVLDKSVGFVYVDENYVYYNSIKDDYRLYRYNKELKFTEKLTDVSVSNAVTLGEYIYYEKPKSTDMRDRNDIFYFRGNTAHKRIEKAENLKKFNDKVLYFDFNGVNTLKYISNDTGPKGLYYDSISYNQSGVNDFWLSQQNVMWYEYGGEGGFSAIGSEPFKPDEEFKQHNLNSNILFKRNRIYEKDSILGFDRESNDAYTIAVYSDYIKVLNDDILVIDVSEGDSLEGESALFIVDTKNRERKFLKPIGNDISVKEIFKWKNMLFYYKDGVRSINIDTLEETIMNIDMDHMAYVYERQIGYWKDNSLYTYDMENESISLIVENVDFINDSEYIFNDYYYYGYNENGKAHIQRIKYDGSSQVEVLTGLFTERIIFQDQYIFAANSKNEVMRYNMESYSHEVIGVMEESFYFDMYSNELVIN